MQSQYKKYFNYLKERSYLGGCYRRFFLYPLINRYLTGCVLDLGCGIGDMLNYRANTVGLDINPLNVEFCKKRKLNAYIMEPDLIPFNDETFDSVLLDNVLEHIKSPVSLLKEIKRVLKPGGLLVIGVPGIKGFKSDEDHKVFYDEKMLHLLCKQNNFELNSYFYTPLCKSTLLSKCLRQYCIYTQWSKSN